MSFVAEGLGRLTCFREERIALLKLSFRFKGASLMQLKGTTELGVLYHNLNAGTPKKTR